MRRIERRREKQEKRKRIEGSNWPTLANQARSGLMHVMPAAKGISNISITNMILTRKDASKRYEE